MHQARRDELALLLDGGRRFGDCPLNLLVRVAVDVHDTVDGVAVANRELYGADDDEYAKRGAAKELAPGVPLVVGPLRRALHLAVYHTSCQRSRECAEDEGSPS